MNALMEITAPQIEYGLLMPFILVFAGACLGVLVEAALPRRSGCSPSSS